MARLPTTREAWERYVDGGRDMEGRDGVNGLAAVDRQVGGTGSQQICNSIIIIVIIIIIIIIIIIMLLYTVHLSAKGTP